MEYREPPRIAATEGRLDGVIDHPEPRPRLRRFELIRAHRQLDLPRVLAAVLVALAGLGILAYSAAHVVRLAVRWLHQQPQYQLRFQDIRLAEPPPAWFRGGSEAFLKQVRENVDEAESLPVLDLAPDRIERDFRLFHWVDDVRRVEYPPQGITVHLVYKQPVARIPIPGGRRDDPRPQRSYPALGGYRYRQAGAADQDHRSGPGTFTRESSGQGLEVRDAGCRRRPSGTLCPGRGRPCRLLPGSSPLPTKARRCRGSASFRSSPLTGGVFSSRRRKAP